MVNNACQKCENNIQWMSYVVCCDVELKKKLTLGACKDKILLLICLKFENIVDFFKIASL